MSAELAARPAHTREPRPIDILREREFNRRVDAGEDEIAAWGAVATDARIGLVDFRGLASLPVAAAVRTYARFLKRMAPAAVEDARARSERAMARNAPKNVKTIQDIADGNFEDAEVARTRLAGAREALKIVGIGADKQTRITAIGTVQAGVAFFDQLRG